MIRQDYSVDKIQETGGYLEIHLQGVPGGNAELSALNSGSLLYLSSGSYPGVHVLQSVSANKILTLTPADPGHLSFGGFLNLVGSRENYYLEIRIKDDNGALLGYRIERPSPEGMITADLRTSARSILSPQNDHPYSNINWPDLKISTRFYIETRERWQGLDPSDPYLVDQISPGNERTYFCLLSGAQIQERGGGNLINYTPVLVDSSDRALFLSDFEEPTYFPGYPFDLSFIWDPGINVEVDRRQDDETSPEYPVGTFTDRLLNYPGRVNRMLIKEDYDPGVTSTQICLIATTESITNCYVEGGYVAPLYVECREEL